MTTASPSSGAPRSADLVPRVLVPETKRFYSSLPELQELPNLIRLQLDSYRWFLKEGLHELLSEISPIQDFTADASTSSNISWI